MQHCIEQVQQLMHIQQIKNADTVFENSRNYKWLTSKRPSLIWLPQKDEFRLRRGFSKVSDQQKIKVLKQLMTILEELPGSPPLKVPEICINLLEKQENSNIINNVTLSRMSSFRNSLRRFSVARNRIAPETLNLPEMQTVHRRSVTFNDELIIHQIYNN